MDVTHLSVEHGEILLDGESLRVSELWRKSVAYEGCRGITTATQREQVVWRKSLKKGSLPKCNGTVVFRMKKATS